MREVIAAESGQRGYLLTGRPEYKEPYTRAAAQVQAQLARLAQIYSAWPDRSADVKKLDELTRQRMSELDTTVKMFENKASEGWRDVVLTDIGRETMLAIEGQARSMARVETARIDESRELLTETLLFSRIGIAALVVVSLAALLLYARQARRFDDERAGARRAAALRARPARGRGRTPHARHHADRQAPADRARGRAQQPRARAARRARRPAHRRQARRRAHAQPPRRPRRPRCSNA